MGPVSSLDRGKAPWSKWAQREWFAWLGWMLIAAVAWVGSAGALEAKLLYIDRTLFDWTSAMQDELGRQLDSLTQVDLVEEKKEPPKEEVKPEPPKEEPQPEPPKAAAPTPTVAPPPPPPPAAAQAAQALTKEEPLDLTGWAIPTGTASSYAGGYTTPAGTSSVAVASPHARSDGVVGGTGTAAPQPPPPPQAPHVSRARAAKVASGSWSCPFPPEADTAQIDEAVVGVRVVVRPDGTAASAQITRDPGNGFGRAASQCAMRQRYVPAWDEDGNPIQYTMSANVTFNR